MRVRSISVREAAAKKKCSSMSILRALKRGEIKLIGTKGKEFLLDPSSVDSWKPRPVGRPKVPTK